MPIVEGRGTTCTTILVDANFPEFCLQTECLVLGTSGDNSCNVMSMFKAYIFSLIISFCDNRVNKVDSYWTQSDPDVFST